VNLQEQPVGPEYVEKAPEINGLAQYQRWIELQRREMRRQSDSARVVDFLREFVASDSYESTQEEMRDGRQTTVATSPQHRRPK
jgi:hypothetical protein